MDEAHKMLREEAAGPPSVSFKPESMRGQWVHGTILKLEKKQQTDFETDELLWWDEAETKPKWELVFTLQTEERKDDEDDGQRRLFAKFKLLAAIKDAIKETEYEGEVIGGKLGVVWYGEGEAVGKKNPPKLYKAKFSPPVATAAVMDTDDGEPEPAAAPTPEPEYDPDTEPF